MKHKLITCIQIVILFELICFTSIAQRSCGTDEYNIQLANAYPDFKSNQDNIESFTERYKLNAMDRRSSDIKVRIPVVVHVIYRTNEQNISDAQILNQIQIMNLDFRKLNSDRNNIPSVFSNFAADTGIEFELAKIDPKGNKTNGITRTKTTKTVFVKNNNHVKFNSEGGKDAWPRDSYLNIWVCSLSPDIVGYAQFPGGPAETDGIVIQFTAFGSIGTAKAPFHLGRTATHEIGHWLNLKHIWGDKTDCTGDDEVSDTPQQGGPNRNFVTFPKISCNNGPDGDMFMNYMDLVDDNCMNMFTSGQTLRMDATLFRARASLLASEGLIASDELKSIKSNTRSVWPQLKEINIK